MADPITLALVGAQVLGGIGTGVGNYMQAQGMMSEQDKETLRKLQRQQEMGALGFTPGELSDVRQNVINPLQAVEQQQNQQMRNIMASQDLGAGSAFRQALGAQESQRRTRAAAEDRVQALNLAEKRRDEAQLAQLARLESQQEAAKKAAIVQAVSGGLIAGGSAASEAALLAKETTPSQSETDAINAANQAAEQVDSLSGYFGGANALGQNIGGNIGQPPSPNMSFAQPNYVQIPSSTGADGIVRDQFGQPMATSPLDEILMGGIR